MQSKVPDAGHHVTLLVWFAGHSRLRQGEHTRLVAAVHSTSTYVFPSVQDAGEQLLHALWPVALAYLPPAHAEQAVLPAADASVPTGHGAHLSAPEASATYPGGQAMHAELLEDADGAGEYVPGRQLLQWLAPSAGAYVPAPQSVHVPAVALDRNVAAGHVLHDETPETIEYLPLEHARHWLAPANDT